MAMENRQINREAAPAAALQEQIPVRRGVFEQEIDLFALLHMLLQHLWVLILCAIVGLTAAGAYTYYFMPSMYRATATIYLYYDNSEMQLGTQMIGDLKIISTSNVVLQQVAEDLQSNVSGRELKGMVSVFNPAGTHMLQISAVSTDPHLAMEVSNSLAERMREQIAEVMNTDKPSWVERATVPYAPYAPNLYKNAAIGAAGGLAAAAGVLVLLFVLDDTIKSKEDIRRYLQLETLAELPYVKELERASAKARRKRFHKRRRSAKKSDAEHPVSELPAAPPPREHRVINVPEQPELGRAEAEHAERTEQYGKRSRRES